MAEVDVDNFSRFVFHICIDDKLDNLDNIVKSKFIIDIDEGCIRSTASKLERIGYFDTLPS